jgi:uncharacterized protein (DUF2141 family)
LNGKCPAGYPTHLHSKDKHAFPPLDKTARNSAAAMALAALAASAQAGTLTLDLKGVQDGQGTLVIALYNNSEDFLKKPLRKLTVPAASAAMRVELPDVPAGDYAVSLYQDLNSDGKAIPIELHK